MNADMFRQLYAYHFALNRKLWDECIVPLTGERFTRKVKYLVGSVRNRVVHIIAGLAGCVGETFPQDYIIYVWEHR